MRRSTLASIGWGTLAFLGWLLALASMGLAGVFFWIDEESLPMVEGCYPTCETTLEAWIFTGVALAGVATGWLSFRRLRRSRRARAAAPPVRAGDPPATSAELDASRMRPG